MSLTENQITAQNFKDFYAQIRPFLNGQVPTFANAFSRGDIFSTDEKIVGMWEDGKPLYQKTFTVASTVTTPASSWATLTLNEPLPSIAIITEGTIMRSSAGVPFPAAIDYYNEKIRIQTFAGFGVSAGAFLTIRYTKTTDTPGAVKYGTGNDYSTDEQIIGSWIDGKPLYQITLDMGLLTNKSTKTTNHNISNIDKIVDINGVAVNSTEAQPIPKSHDTDIKYQIQVTANHTSVSVFNRGYDYSSFNAYVTLKYTKTTD